MVKLERPKMFTMFNMPLKSVGTAKHLAVLTAAAAADDEDAMMSWLVLLRAASSALGLCSEEGKRPRRPDAAGRTYLVRGKPHPPRFAPQAQTSPPPVCGRRPQTAPPQVCLRAPAGAAARQAGPPPPTHSTGLYVLLRSYLSSYKTVSNYYTGLIETSKTHF